MNDRAYIAHVNLEQVANDVHVYRYDLYWYFTVVLCKITWTIYSAVPCRTCIKDALHDRYRPVSAAHVAGVRQVISCLKLSSRGQATTQ